MATNWVRGKAELPAKRRVVLIYETADPINASLEQLLERTPYGHGNKTLLECLRAGAKAMLGQLDGLAGDTARSATPPPAKAPAAITSSPPSPSPSQENGSGFSQSAQRMFELGGEGKP